MPAAGVSDVTKTYFSNLVETVSAPDDAERTLEAAPLNGLPQKGSGQDPELPQWIRLYHHDKVFAAFVNDLFSLYADEDEEMPPSKQVVESILHLTTLPKKLLAQAWRNPRITTDGKAGIRMSWRLAEREVRVVIPAEPSRPKYLYWQNRSLYDGIQNFGPTDLYKWLSWLNAREG